MWIYAREYCFAICWHWIHIVILVKPPFSGQTEVIIIFSHLLSIGFYSQHLHYASYIYFSLLSICQINYSHQ